MIGAGTFISPLIKIVTTVAILAAVYFFVVKPTLDTTNEAIDRSFDAFSPAIEQAQNVGPQIEKSIKQAQKLQDTSAQTSSQQIQQATKLLNCINGASGNVDKIQNCNVKHSP
jgi:predicted PurR-regulated permease PerM